MCHANRCTQWCQWEGPHPSYQRRWRDSVDRGWGSDVIDASDWGEGILPASFVWLLSSHVVHCSQWPLYSRASLHLWYFLQLWLSYPHRLDRRSCAAVCRAVQSQLLVAHTHLYQSHFDSLFARVRSIPWCLGFAYDIRMKYSGALFPSSSPLDLAETGQAMTKVLSLPMNSCSAMAQVLSEPVLASELTAHSWQLPVPSIYSCLMLSKLWLGRSYAYWSMTYSRVS